MDPIRTNPITDKWYEMANSYTPDMSKSYGWVMEYAKFRLQFAFGNGRYIEEKSIGLFKTVLTICAGIWAVFSWILSRGIIPAWPVSCLVALSVILLLCSGMFALRAFGPSDRPVPLAEDVALRTVEKFESSEVAMGIFSLSLAASTQYQSQLTTDKGRMVRIALRFAYFAIMALVLSVFFQVYIQTFPTAGLAVG